MLTVMLQSLHMRKKNKKIKSCFLNTFGIIVYITVIEVVTEKKKNNQFVQKKCFIHSISHFITKIRKCIKEKREDHKI